MAIALGLVMALAGASKLASPTWPAQARDLGAPAFAVPVLPWVELGLASMLVIGVARPLAGAATAVLLAAFTTLIALRLREGIRPPCACFGGRSSRPIGARTVARNAGLFLAAVAVAVFS